MTPASLAREIDRLDRDVQRPALPTDPYELILYENAGYLVDDDRRTALLRRLLAHAPTPAKLLAAPQESLVSVAREGGMRPATRVERWRLIARIVLDVGGDLRAALLQRDDRARRTLLRSFPAIGEPGADLVRLFALEEPCATIESNGLRVLERLGFVTARAPYPKQYREAAALLTEAFPTVPALQRAWFVLRHHGKSICRRAAPDHPRCRATRRCDAALGRGE